MAIDRGSLRYKIVLEATDALTGLRSFREGLIKTRQSWRKFKEDLEGVQGVSSKAASGLGELARATKKARDEAQGQEGEAKRRRKGSKEFVHDLQKEGQGLRTLGETTKKLGFEQRRIRELKRGIGKEQVRAGSDEIKNLETALGLLRGVTAAQLRLARAQRLAGTGRDIKTAGTFEDELKLKILENQNKIERLQSVESNQQLQNARAELEAQKALLRVELEQLRSEKLKGRGALPSGKTVDQAAQQALDRERDLLRIRSRQSELLRQQTSEQRLTSQQAKVVLASERTAAAAQLRLLKDRDLRQKGLLSSGLSLRQAAIQALRAEREALEIKKAQIAVENRLSTEERNQLAAMKAELAVQNFLRREEEQRLRSEGLRAQGALPSGKTVDQTAQEALDRERDTLAVRTRQAELLRKQTLEQDLSSQKAKANLATERAVAAAQLRVLRDKKVREQGLLASGLSLRQAAEKALRSDQEALKVKRLQGTIEAGLTAEERAQLAAMRAELVVQKTLLRNEQQRLAAEALSRQGRTAGGATVQQAAAEAFRRDIERLRIEQLRRKLQETNPEFVRLRQELHGTGREAVGTGGRLRTLQNVLDSLGSRTNRISFTFRRLIGIFAAFAAARAIVRIFKDSITEQVRFSAQLEQTELGVASLLTAVGEVRTATGATADASERLALAQKASRQQLALLRKDALATVATFQQLTETFEVAIAPGLQAGLGLDRIRAFTIQISQAAAAIGLQQNQLAEEIRAILSGAISIRQTRIAAALGITPEDIRRAKELGILSEFLDEKFQAFTVAGQKALGLFNAVVARLTDAFGLLLQEGGEEFFENLKALLSEVLDLLVDVNATGVDLDPRAVAVVKEIFTGLSAAVDEARRLREELSLGDSIALGRALGSTIASAAKLVGALVEGFLRGAKDLASILRPLADQLRDILPGDTARDFVVQLTRALVVFGGLSVIATTFLSAFGFLLAPIAKLVSLAISLGSHLGTASGFLLRMLAPSGSLLTIFRAILSPVGLLAVLIATVLFEMGKLLADTFGIEVRFGTIAKLVRTSLVNSFKFATAAIKFLWIGLTNSLAQGLDVVVSGFRESMAFVIEKALQAADFIPSVDTSTELANLRVSREQDRADFQRDLEERKAETIKAAREAATAAIEAFKNVRFGFATALAENDAAETLEEFLERTKKALKEGFKNFGLESGAFEFGLESAEDKAKNLVERLRELPGIIAQGKGQAEGLEDTLKDIAEELTKAQQELELSIKVEGLEGFTQDLTTELVEREFRIRKETLAINKEVEALELRRAENLAQIARLEQEANRGSVSSAENTRKAVEAGELQLNLENEIATAKNRRAALEATAIALERQRRFDEANAVRKDAAAQDKRIRKLQEELDFTEGVLQAISETLATEGGDRALQIVEEIITARGRERAAEEDQIQLGKDRTEVEQQINDVISLRVEALARRQIQQAQERIGLAKAELAEQQRLSLFAGVLREGAPERGLVEATSSLQIERAQLTLLEERRKKQKEADRDHIQDLLQSKATEETIHQTILAQQAARKELAIEISKQGFKVEESLGTVEEERRKLEEPVTFGLEAGLQDFIDESKHQFDAWRRIANNALHGFAATSAGILTAALDPTQDVNALEAFGQLFLDIFNQVIENIIQQGLAQLLGGLIALDTGSAGLLTGAAAIGAASIPLQAAATTLLIAAALLKGFGGGGGAAPAPTYQGGRISGHNRFPSPAHRHARGAAQGRMIQSRAAIRRPSWVHPRDTVPLWGEPGEWMIRTRAVRKYGNDFMRALNEGKISVPAARAMMQSSVRSPSRNLSSPSMQSGGLVSSNLARANELSAQGIGEGRRRALLQRSILVANEETWERLAAAGPRAQERWIRRNSNEATLSQTRR